MKTTVRPLDERAIDPLKAMADAHEEAPNIGVTRFALKQATGFLVANSFGDIEGFAEGLFQHDTRLLSRFLLRIGGRRPVLLGAALSHDNVVFEANLTNSSILAEEGNALGQGTVYLSRRRFLWQNRMFDRLSITNFALTAIRLPVSFELEADFRDIFEVRGLTRQQRGKLYPPQAGPDFVRFGYLGLDGVERVVQLCFSHPVTWEPARGTVSLVMPIPRGARRVLYIEAGADAVRPERARHRKQQAEAHRAMKVRRRRGAMVHTSGPIFNDWLNRTRADIALLTTDLPTGPYPFAGIPWFSTAFGRDGIITALEMLWLDPGLARGVLQFLADKQSHVSDAVSDAEPGKILHETRSGEMSRLKEVPFAEYYGGVDTTPLFVHLAAEYARRTADEGLIDGLWPVLRKAVEWIEARRAEDPRGFVTYARAAESGLRNQGWKDSFDAIFHADGSLASKPIALVEVQGYAFLALNGMADMASRRGEEDYAIALRAKAEQLRQDVERHFWMEKERFYAIALDGSGRQCKVRTSNAGQLLYSGLPSPERGRDVARALLQPDFYSGWGLRTVAKGEARYNPMSYHNGSVWPHDNAICAAGIVRYSNPDSAAHALTRLFEAVMHFSKSVPELFCGFPRVQGEGPVAYPVACLPQAWSAGSVFLLLQTCIGLEIDAFAREISVKNPRLPHGIDHLALRQLEICGTPVTLNFDRRDDRVTCAAERPRGTSIGLVMRDQE